MLPFYPCEKGCIGFDLETYLRLLSWAVENVDYSGKVRLYEGSYFTIIELTQCDDLPCLSSFGIEHTLNSQNYALSLSYRRTGFYANINKLNDQ